MERKRVVIVAAVFKPEPVVSAGLMFDIAYQLSSKYDVTVLKPKPTRPLGFNIEKYNYDDLPFKVITLDSFTYPESKLIGRLRESISHGLAAAKYIKEHNKDIDFVFNDSWHLFGLYTVAKTAKKLGIPYITPVQDVYPEVLMDKTPYKLLRRLIKSVLGPIDSFTLKNASKVHTISPYLVNYLSKTRSIPKERFVLVRNWQDEKRFIDYKETTPDHAHEKFTFMFLGSVGFLTGLEKVIEAFKIAGLKDARLIIAGNGTARESLQELAKSYKECDFKFIDAPFDDVPRIQSEADVFLLPLKIGVGKTSVPSKLPAYMFSAKPVIASVDAESDTALCIKEADAGWIAKPEDVEDIAHCMMEAYQTSKDKLKKMGQRGYDYAIQRFSKKVNLPILVDACIEVIESTF